MANKHYYPLLYAAAIISIPSAASANAGTPMMWAAMLHLTLGNLVIGIIEGSLIAWLFKVNVKKAIGVMITANYVSAYAGAFGLGFLQEFLSRVNLIHTPLYDAPKLLWATGVALFVATVIIEYPFCLISLRLEKHNLPRLFKKAMIASLIVQAVSYTLLVPYYLAASPISVYTRLDTDRSLSFARGNKATVYFISSDGDICRIGVDGTNRRKVLESNLKDKNWRLFVRKQPKSQTWDLWAKDRDDEGGERLLIKRFAAKAVPSWSSLEFDGKESWGGFGDASDFRTEDERDWEFSTGFWPAEGLRAFNQKTRQSIRIALETPFMSWTARNATVLPDDLVVFEFGDQVVLLDIEARKIGLLAIGKGPIVVQDTQ